jgi:plasmid stabilization system protein ParE
MIPRALLVTGARSKPAALMGRPCAGERGEYIDGIFAWINEDSPIAAMLVIRRIRQSIARLATSGMSEIGRAGRDAGTRELIEGPTLLSMTFTRRTD